MLVHTYIVKGTKYIDTTFAKHPIIKYVVIYCQMQLINYTITYAWLILVHL